MAKSPTEPMDQLKNAGSQLLKTAGDRAVSSLQDKAGDLTEKLEGVADGGPLSQAFVRGGKEAAEGGSAAGGAVKGALSGLKDKVTGGGGGGGSSSSDPTSSTNLIESIDVGVPLSVAYNQWTDFGAFPGFMKKVEHVDDQEDAELSWKAQIFLSHRTWQATVTEQVADERIVWKSTGEKGHVDGAVTFHELGPNLTRILLVLEYYPQGLFEKTGNIWRAQGRRARAELRHFRRHVMTRTILDPDEVEGWRGEIRDGEVVRSHEEVVEDEQADEQEEQDDEQQDDVERAEDELDDEPDEEEADDVPDEELLDEDEPADEDEELDPEEDDLDEEPEDR